MLQHETGGIAGDTRFVRFRKTFNASALPVPSQVVGAVVAAILAAAEDAHPAARVKVIPRSVTTFIRRVGSFGSTSGRDA